MSPETPCILPTLFLVELKSPGSLSFMPEVKQNLKPMYLPKRTLLCKFLKRTIDCGFITVV